MDPSEDDTEERGGCECISPAQCFSKVKSITEEVRELAEKNYALARSMRESPAFGAGLSLKQ